MKRGVVELAEDLGDSREEYLLASRIVPWRALIIAVFTAGVFLLYAMTMPIAFPPDADAIRWAQWVESSKPVWESRHLLAWPLEKTFLELWRVVGYQGKAFVPMQVMHAALAAMALGGIVWLLMLRGVRWRHAVMFGLVIGLSFAWFGYARSAHVRVPSVAVGVLAVVMALGLAERQLRRLSTVAMVAILSGLAVVLQINGIVFLPAAAVALAWRAHGHGSAPLGRVLGVMLAALTLAVVAYAGVWHSSKVKQQYSSVVAWIAEHPEQKTLDAALSLKQALRAGAGIVQALGGGGAVLDVAKAFVLGSVGQTKTSVADWTAFLAGITALTIGCIATVVCTARRATRVDGVGVALLLTMIAGFALQWTGSDAWLWLAPVAFLWYAIGLCACRNPRGGWRTTAILGLAVALSAAGAYRQIEAPCMLTGKSSAPVRSAMAYAAQTAPGDLAVGFWGWTNWVDYGLDRNRLYLYHLSFAEDWRRKLTDGLRNAQQTGGVFVTADVMEPTDIDTVEMWDRVGKSNGMARAEVLRVLRQAGELVRRDGMLPDEPIWELKRK